MGQTLSEPVTSKETTGLENEQMSVGASSMQGWRVNMEDAHTHILSLAPDDPDASFFAVYDGHGGAKVAHYAGNHLHRSVLAQPEYKEGNIEEAIRKGFLKVDEDMLVDPEMREELAGTTAIIVLIKNNKLYIGNVGDSRAVASFSGRADPLSIDHKPSLDSESKRIIAAGGWVEFNRVNGNLALSRALGDFVFKRNEKKDAKEQIVTAYPEVQSREITEDLEFIVIACDGIWDVLSNEEVVDFIRTRIAGGMVPSQICEELMTRCLAPDCAMGGLGCDNMTVVLVCFLNGKPYKELSSKCSKPSVATVRHEEDQHQENGISSSEGYTSDEPSNDSSTSPSSTPDSLTADQDPVKIVVEKDSKGSENDSMDEAVPEIDVPADPDQPSAGIQTKPTQGPDPLLVA